MLIDTTDFIQGLLVSSLVFSAKVEGTVENLVITWFVFHHKNYDNIAADSLRWVLSGYVCTIELDIGALLLWAEDLEWTIQIVCSRAYARSICYWNYWPLYPRLVYLLYLMSEKINQGDADSTSGESGDEES